MMQLITMSPYLEVPKKSCDIINQFVVAVAPLGPQIDLTTLVSRNSLIKEYICFGTGIVLSIEGKHGRHVHSRPSGFCGRYLLGVSSEPAQSLEELTSSPEHLVPAEQLRPSLNKLWFLVHKSKPTANDSQQDDLSSFALIRLGDCAVVHIDSDTTVRHAGNIRSYYTHDVAAAAIWVDAPGGEHSLRYLNVRELLDIKVRMHKQHYSDELSAHSSKRACCILVAWIMKHSYSGCYVWLALHAGKYSGQGSLHICSHATVMIPYISMQPATKGCKKVAFAQLMHG